MRRYKLKTYKVRFIFFKAYKSVEVVALSANEAEDIVCERYSIPKHLKKTYAFSPTLVK